MAFENNKAITGSMVTLFANGYPCGVVTNIEVQIRRDVQPLHVMFGNPNPSAWAYGIRRVSGRMDFASLNGEGAMGVIPSHYKYFMSMTESLEVLDSENVSISDDEAIDENTGMLKPGNTSSTAGDGFAMSLASMKLKEAALANLIFNGSNGKPGVVSWTKQTPRYLDQATNLSITFLAFLEGQVGKMYARTLYQIAFHTHNIQVGMTVGAIETGEFFANNISKWKTIENTGEGDNATFDIGGAIVGANLAQETDQDLPDIPR